MSGKAEHSSIQIHKLAQCWLSWKPTLAIIWLPAAKCVAALMWSILCKYGEQFEVQHLASIPVHTNKKASMKATGRERYHCGLVVWHQKHPKCKIFQSVCPFLCCGTVKLKACNIICWLFCRLSSNGPKPPDSLQLSAGHATLNISRVAVCLQPMNQAPEHCRFSQLKSWEIRNTCSVKMKAQLARTTTQVIQKPGNALAWSIKLKWKPSSLLSCSLLI